MAIQANAPAIVSAGGTIKIVNSGNYVPAIYERNYDYSTFVPLDYWKEDALIVPTSHANRVRQFEVFKQLYDGEYWRWGNYEVKLNYHEIVANFMADLLMGFPPEFEGTDELCDRFINTLLDSLHCFIVDMIRYGTGLLQVVPTQRGPEVVALDPTYWYPASADFDVYVEIMEDTINLYISGSDGTYVVETYENRDNSKLGALISVEDMSAGEISDWDIIYEKYTGRVGNIVNVGRRPFVGNFGRSLYPSITNLALEAARGSTDDRDTIIEMLKPLILWLSDGESYEVKRPKNQNERLEAETRQIWLEQLRGNPSMELPHGIIDGKYLTYQPDMNASFMHNEEIEKKLFVATNISAELYGLGTEEFPPSGVALDRHYLRSAIYARGFQTNNIDAVSKILAIGAIHSGIVGAQLSAFIENLSVVWPLVFDRIEETTDVTLDDGGVEAESEPAPEENNNAFE